MAKFVPDAVEELEDVVAYGEEAKAPNTRRAYAADWRDFVAHLRKRGRSLLPADPDDVALYLRHMVVRRGLKIATVSHRLAAVAKQHQANGYGLQPTSGLSETHCAAFASNTARPHAVKLLCLRQTSRR